MNRDFETVDLTRSFYETEYNEFNNYLISDTIIEINDSFTHGNSPRRKENNNTRNRRRRRPTNSPINNNNHLVNDTVIEINSATPTPVKKDGPRKRRRDGGPNAPSNKVNQEDATEISPKKARTSALECPICWDDMLNKPLASTKCGHVFCKSCLKKSLKTMKSCPKCRQSLTGSKAFHPLYLS